MTIKEYLEERLKRSEKWKSNNLPNDLYHVYANVEISILESIIRDFEPIKDMEIVKST